MQPYKDLRYFACQFEGILDQASLCTAQEGCVEGGRHPREGWQDQAVSNQGAQGKNSLDLPEEVEG